MIGAKKRFACYTLQGYTMWFFLHIKGIFFIKKQYDFRNTIINKVFISILNHRFIVPKDATGHKE